MKSHNKTLKFIKEEKIHDIAAAKERYGRGREKGSEAAGQMETQELHVFIRYLSSLSLRKTPLVCMGIVPCTF